MPEENEDQHLSIAKIDIDVFLCGHCSEMHVDWKVDEPDQLPPLLFMGVLQSVSQDVSLINAGLFIADISEEDD